MSAFNLSWANLPGWKLAVGLIAIAVLAALLVVMIIRGMHAFPERNNGPGMEIPGL